MPYIISTINGCSCCDERKPGLPGAGGAAHLCGDCSDSDGRVAVATLDEARETASDAILAHDQTIGEFGAEAQADGAVSESGGTIGPLPDGTVIEVRPATWHDVIEGAGGGFPLLPDSAGERAEVLAAFNAA